MPGNVFVTGASAGIGAAATRLLVEQGYTVYAGVHKDTGTLDALPDVRQVAINVADPDSVAAAARQVAAQIASRGGDAGLQAVVNSAGLIVQGPLELVHPEDLRYQFDVNTFGPAYVIAAFLPLLRAGQGRVINISAPTARIPTPFLAPLAASKAALASMSDALRLELAAWHIPVCVVEPGATQTAIFAKADAASQSSMARADPGLAGLYRDQLAAFGKVAAKQKLGPVEPIAQTILTAIQAGKPKRRYSVGTGVRQAGVLAHLPGGLRERLISTFFGLGRIDLRTGGTQAGTAQSGGAQSGGAQSGGAQSGTGQAGTGQAGTAQAGTAR
jgi:NAD(P)-dependent dehydrogenase (short-subunit alcohol dehydrogenase family)